MGVLALGLGLAAATAARAEPLTIFAAISTTNALTEIVKAYRKQGGEVRVSFGATSVLAKQIENGAPADIFLSADNKWMDRLEKSGLIKTDTRTTIVANTLVIIAPKDGDFSVKIEKGMKFFEALKGKRLAVGDPDHTAVGLYFKDAGKYLGFWEKIEPALARAGSVVAGLSMVERGEVGAGVVFKTVGLISPKVRIVGEFPEESHGPITYPIAQVAASRNPAVQEFYAFLRTDTSRAAFAKYGFSPRMK
jgi:molybdate transport system substrate-binding protein